MSNSNPEKFFNLHVIGLGYLNRIRRVKPSRSKPFWAVIVGFKLGDVYPELFTYKSGKKQGQTGVSLKGRLLQITWAKIDGQPVELLGDTESTAVY